MNSTRGNLRFNKVIDILICFGGLGVLGLNVLLLRQNQRLQNTLAPQIAAGAHLERLAGLALDGRIAPVTLPFRVSSCSSLLFLRIVRLVRPIRRDGRSSQASCDKRGSGCFG